MKFAQYWDTFKHVDQLIPFEERLARWYFIKECQTVYDREKLPNGVREYGPSPEEVKLFPDVCCKKKGCGCH